MEKTILKLLATWLHSNITPFSRVIVPVVLSSLNVTQFFILPLLIFLSLYFFLQQASAHALDDNFFELLSRCQGNRMEEQRAELPNSKTKNGGKNDSNCSASHVTITSVLLPSLKGTVLPFERCDFVFSRK